MNKIDDVLGQMVPILIGFLASAMGVGGIGEKIKEILQKLQKPVNVAIDFLIKKGLQLAGPIIAKIKGIGSKMKGKVEAGKAWVKGKVEAGKAWVKGRLGALTGQDRKAPQASPPEGTVLGTASTSAAGHTYQGRAVAEHNAVAVYVSANADSGAPGGGNQRC